MKCVKTKCDCGDLAQRVTKVVTQRINGPAVRHNAENYIKEGGHGGAHVFLSDLACSINIKKLKEDEDR